MSKITISPEVKALMDSGLVRAILSYNPENKKAELIQAEADILLLNDGKTYIELKEQDYYAYHDCDSSARTIQVRVNPMMWNFYLKEYTPCTMLT